MKPLLLVLILSASATIQAQIFEVDYLYRAPNKPNKPERVFGVMTLDSAKKTLTFTSRPAGIRKQPMVKLDITADTATGATYERESAPSTTGTGGGLLTTLLVTGLTVRGDKRFVTLQYKTESGEGKYAIFHFENGKDVREAQAAIEATLGIH